MHGFAVDEKGKKMSKSLGNVIHPADMIAAHSMDTLRWWVAAHTVGAGPISVKPQLIDDSAELLAKIRKILRYLVGYADKMPKSPDFDIASDRLTPLDVHSLNALVTFDRRAQQLATDYRFPAYTLHIGDFVFNALSATYLHMTKDRLYLNDCRENGEIFKIFFAHFHTVCKHLWPIVPHLVEEVWSHYDAQRPFYASPFRVPDTFANAEFDEAMAVASTLIALFRANIKKDTWHYRAQVWCDEKAMGELQVRA